MPDQPPSSGSAAALLLSSRAAVQAVVRDVETACGVLLREITSAHRIHGDENATYSATASLCDASRYAELGVFRIADRSPDDLPKNQREFLLQMCEGLLQRAAETVVDLLREGHLQRHHEEQALRFTSRILERARRVSALRVEDASLRPLFTGPAAELALPPLSAQ